MIPIFKSCFSVFMAVLSFFFSTFFGEFAQEYTTQRDNCKLSFAAISDTHLTNESYRRGLLELALCDMENSISPIDALVMAGDMTNHARSEEYEHLYTAFSKYTPAKNIVMAVGNHDTWNDEADDLLKFQKSKELFIEYNKSIANRNIDKTYYSTVINGYTFIVLGSEGDGSFAHISPEQLDWLDKEMKKATATGLPVFVVSHWPFEKTHGLPLTWLDHPSFQLQDKAELKPNDGGFGAQNDDIKNILNKYQNVFLISGHLHNGIAQNNQYGYSSVERYENIISVNLPSFAYPGTKGAASNGMGFQFEVYENEVVIRTRCFTAGVWYPQDVFTVALQKKDSADLGDVTVGDWKPGDIIDGEATAS